MTIREWWGGLFDIDDISPWQFQEVKGESICKHMVKTKSTAQTQAPASFRTSNPRPNFCFQ